MNLNEALVAALYPVIVILCSLVWLRYYPLLRTIADDGLKALVAAMLVMVATVAAEQVYYGLGRFVPAQYHALSHWIPVVGILKCGYISSLCLNLFAFWKISPQKVTLSFPFFMAGIIWVCIVLALMV